MVITQGLLMDQTFEEQKYTIARQDRQQHVDSIVTTETDKKLVVAGPGTGKTYLFRTLLQGKTNTLMLTFVNALVADLSLELFGLSDVKTLHAFARGQLYRVTQKSVWVFPKLSEVIKEDARILLGDEIDFDYLFHNRADLDPILEFYEERKKYYGHYGFTDLIYASVLYFEQNKDKIPIYDQIVVDEFQDFNALEVSLIDLLSSKSPILLTGDDDQALYESLKSASAKYIRERHNDALHGYTNFKLPYCSRSTRVIVDAANDIISHARENDHLQDRIDKPFRYFDDATKDAESEANPHIVYARVYAKQIPWFIQERVKDITKDLRTKFSVLILSPTRTQCNTIYKALKAKGFENIRFSEKRSSAEPTLLDGLKLLLEDTESNLGWRVVAKLLLDEAEFQTLLEQAGNANGSIQLSKLIDADLKRRVSQMLKTLRLLRGKKSVAEDKIDGLLRQIGVDVYGAAVQSLQDELISKSLPLADSAIRGTSITATTIQSSKGLASDYVFITHFDDRYCVRDKDKSRVSDQDVCSFLVALTRARRGVFLLSTDRSKTPIFLNWIEKSRICEMEVPGGR